MLGIPVPGRVLVWDGHDFYAHHRRLDLAHPVIGKLGLTANPGRYAYDLSVVDEKGLMFRGDGGRREDWYGWETPVRAPGDGTIAEMRSDVADHQVGENPLSMEQILATPKVLFGNYVTVDHGNGEFSLMAHLRQGSVTVKKGDRVKRGQVIGKMGFSGDAFTVHTHYELRAGTDMNVEGVPSRFHGFERVLGSRTVPVAEGAIDTGDIVLVK